MQICLLPCSRRPVASGVVESVRGEELDWIRRGTAGVGTTLRTQLPAGVAVYGALDLEHTEEQDLAHTEEQDLALLGALVGPAADRSSRGARPQRCRGARAGHRAGAVRTRQELCTSWRYRFRRRSPEAVRERVTRGADPDPWRFPRILFPEDRRFLDSTLWDDSWRSIGVDEATADRIRAAQPAFEPLDPGLDLRSTGRELS